MILYPSPQRFIPSPLRGEGQGRVRERVMISHSLLPPPQRFIPSPSRGEGEGEGDDFAFTLAPSPTFHPLPLEGRGDILWKISAADTEILEARGPHLLRLINVAQIAKNPAAHESEYFFKIQAAVFIPLREQDHGIGAGKYVMDGGAILNAVRQQFFRLLHAVRVMRAHDSALLDERRQDGQRRG